MNMVRSGIDHQFFFTHRHSTVFYQTVEFKKKMMNNIPGLTIKEIEFHTPPFILCKNCEDSLAEIIVFKNHSIGYWRIKIRDLNLSIRLTYENKKAFCGCGNFLGELLNNEVLKIKKNRTIVSY